MIPDPALSGPDPRDAFDLRHSLIQILEACRIHAWMLIVTPAFALALILIYIWLWPPIYSAQADVLAEPDQDNARQEFYYYWDMFRKEDVRSEVGLMNSDAIFQDVVQKLHLTYNDVYHPFFSQAAHMWTASLPGRAYHKFKRLVFPRHGLYQPTDEQVELAQMVSDMKKGIAVVPVPESHLGMVTVKGPSPRVAEITNAFLKSLLENRRQRYIHESTMAYEAIKPEAEAAKRDLLAAEEQRKTYFTSNDIVMEFEKQKIDVSNFGALDASIDDITAQLAGLKQKQADLRSQLAAEPAEAVNARTLQRNPARQEIERQRTETEAAISDELTQFHPDAPEVKELQKRLAAESKLLDTLPAQLEYSTTTTTGTRDVLHMQLSQSETDIATLTATLAAKQTERTALHKQLAVAPNQVLTVHAMERDESTLEKKYMILQDRLMMAQVSMAAARSAPESIKIIDWATPPSEADWPRAKLLILAALALGLLAGMSLAMLVELIFPRVTLFKLNQQTATLPIFATIDGTRRIDAALDMRLARLRSLPS